MCVALDPSKYVFKFVKINTMLSYTFYELLTFFFGKRKIVKYSPKKKKEDIFLLLGGIFLF